MAQPSTATFGKFVVLVGNGAAPEVFVAPCGFTERSLELKSDTSSTQVPDCDDPDAPAWEDRDVRTLSASVSGQGVMALEALRVWRDWYFTAAERNVRLRLDLPAGKAPGYYEGAAILTSLKHDSNIGEKCKLSVALENTGAWVWISAGSLVATVPPTISGTARVGQTLTASQGTWAGGSPTSYAYQWKRAGTVIQGATGSTYVPVSADVGSALTVTVTATAGSATGVSSSAATVAVAAAVATSAPGGGPNNTADHTDSNNAYLLALMAA